MKRSTSIGLSVVVLTVILCVCTKPGDVAGPSTETGNPSITAVLVDNGNAPVADAVVRVYRVEYTPTPPDTVLRETLTLVDSKTSDASGAVRVYGLAKGVYTVEAYHPATATAAVLAALPVDAAPAADTLVMQGTGSIRGTVVRDSAQFASIDLYIQVRVQGTTMSTTTVDSQGNYRLDGVPQGCYRVQYLAGGGYLSMILDSVCVIADDTTDVAPVTLYASPAGPPPAPYVTSFGYDSITKVVNIGWREIRVSDIYGYEVVRLDSMRNVLKTSAVMTGRYYQDTVSAVAAGTQLYYAVKAVDADGNRSVFSGFAGPVDVK